MRAYAFLGEGLRAYQSAVVDLLRERTALPLSPLVKGELSALDAIAGGPPALLFLCGLPYTRWRDRGFPLEPLVAPVGADEPGDAPVYRSHLLGRPGLAGTQLREHTGLRLAINGRDSLSGWVLPVGAGLPLDRIAEIDVSGGHVASMRALLAGAADVAAVDTMLLAAEVDAEPAFATLPVLATYGPTTSPPIVLVGGSAVDLDTLRRALTAMADDDEGRAALRLGRIERLAPVDDASYDAVREFDREVATCAR